MPPATRSRTRTATVGGVSVHYLATPLRCRWMGITPSLPLWLERSPRPDIVHLLGFRDVVTTATSWWARTRHVPYVLEPLDMYVARYRNVPLKRAFDALFGRPVARSAAAIVAVSELERQELAAAGVPIERVRVRPNGFPTPVERRADGSLRERIGVDAHTPVVLNVGRISFK